MSYLYGVKFKAPKNELILALRQVRLDVVYPLSGAHAGYRNSIQPITIP